MNNKLGSNGNLKAGKGDEKKNNSNNGSNC